MGVGEEMPTCVLPGTLFPEAKTICGGWMMTPVCWGRPPCRGARTCADGKGESHSGTVSPVSHSRLCTLCGWTLIHNICISQKMTDKRWHPLLILKHRFSLVDPVNISSTDNSVFNTAVSVKLFSNKNLK